MRYLIYKKSEQYLNADLTQGSKLLEAGFSGQAATHSIFEAPPELKTSALERYGCVVTADSAIEAASRLGMVLSGVTAEEVIYYSEMKVGELRELASKRKVKGARKLKKAELVAALSED